MGFVTNRFKGVLNKDPDEKKLVDGLLNGDPKIINYIYRRNMPVIMDMKHQYPNMILEADDVLQEGMTRALINVRAGKFNKQSSFHTYLYGICKNICLKETEKTKKTEEVENQLINEANDDNYFDLLKTVLLVKNRMGDKCLKIINMRFNLDRKETGAEENQKLLPFDQIAEKLGLEADNARQRYSRCLKKLIDGVYFALNLQLQQAI
jgi:RNA polymerase sigma factor (sigma-70 family)